MYNTTEDLGICCTHGLRDLALLDDVVYGVDAFTSQDLLIAQVSAEVQELLLGGLHRGYTTQEASLANPRDRSEFERYFYQVGMHAAELPYVHYPRLPDTLLQRTVLDGVRLGIGLAQDLELLARLRRLAQQLESDVSVVGLTNQVLNAVDREADGTMWAYRPAPKLIRLLQKGQRLDLQSHGTIALPGFLFDMNRLFQALLLRFLHQHLPATPSMMSTGCVT